METRAFPLYLEKRGITIDNSLFKIYKIRTIKPFALSSISSNKFFLNKPYLYKQIPYFCKIFRKYGLDELPQLINVLTGEISIVGPRPLNEYDLNILKWEHPYENSTRQKLKSKPGIIGLWQIQDERELGAANLILWDARYEMKKSFLFDLSLITAIGNHTHRNPKQASEVEHSLQKRS